MARIRLLAGDQVTVQLSLRPLAGTDQSCTAALTCRRTTGGLDEGIGDGSAPQVGERGFCLDGQAEVVH